MKKIIVALFCLLALLAFSACGADDPNAGIYEGVSVAAEGVTLDITDVFEKGASIELKKGGKGSITLEGKEFPLKWSLEETDLTVTVEDEVSHGTLENNTIVLDLMGTGLQYTFNKVIEEDEATGGPDGETTDEGGAD